MEPFTILPSGAMKRALRGDCADYTDQRWVRVAALDVGPRGLVAVDPAYWRPRVDDCFDGVVTAAVALLLDAGKLESLLGRTCEPARAALGADSLPADAARGVLAGVFLAARATTGLPRALLWLGLAALVSWGLALALELPAGAELLLLVLGPCAGPLLAPSLAALLAILEALRVTTSSRPPRGGCAGG